MNRREFSAAALLAGAGVSLATPAARAQGSQFVAGTDYVVLDKRAPVEAPAGKIEVIEFFWYSCPHCNAFEPELDQWVAKLPKDVFMRRVPVQFNPGFEPEQRLYYTLKEMGKIDELHVKVFHAIHVEHLPLDKEAGIVDWARKQGLDMTKFGQIYNSFSVATKVRQAVELQNLYKVTGVPSMGVAGRFYTDGELAKGMDRCLRVVDFLIDKARKGA